jgi:inosose dehydratase
MRDLRAAVSRRAFLRATAAGAAGCAFAPALARGEAPAGFALRLGYAAITWDGRDEQAIDEIAELGFHGIQLRSASAQRYGDKPAELRRRLEDKGLALLCFSSGTVDAVPEREREHLDAHLRNARFVAALGGDTLQLISHRPDGRAPQPAEFERLGRLMNEIGRRSLDLGVHTVYHNHMGGFGESPEEVVRVLDATDQRYVSLLLDIAHYAQGGGDPVKAVERHKDRITILHLKDVVSPLPAGAKTRHEGYQFVELGRGKVDVPGVIASLKKIAFRGPAIIELDAPPDPARTAKQCAALNKQYVVETLGLSL